MTRQIAILEVGIAEETRKIELADQFPEKPDQENVAPKRARGRARGCARARARAPLKWAKKKTAKLSSGERDQRAPSPKSGNAATAVDPEGHAPVRQQKVERAGPEPAPAKKQKLEKDVPEPVEPRATLPKGGDDATTPGPEEHTPAEKKKIERAARIYDEAQARDDLANRLEEEAINLNKMAWWYDQCHEEARGQK